MYNMWNPVFSRAATMLAVWRGCWGTGNAKPATTHNVDAVADAPADASKLDSQLSGPDIPLINVSASHTFLRWVWARLSLHSGSLPLLWRLGWSRIRAAKKQNNRSVACGISWFVDMVLYIPT